MKRIKFDPAEKVTKAIKIAAAENAKAEAAVTPRKGNPNFRKGMKALPGAGRPKGSTNHVTLEIKQAMLTAMAMLGRDGQGKDAVEGYFAHIAWTKPEIFGRLLERLLPFMLTGANGGPVQVEYRDKQQIIQRMKERGLPIPESLMAMPTHEAPERKQ